MADDNFRDALMLITCGMTAVTIETADSLSVTTTVLVVDRFG